MTLPRFAIVLAAACLAVAAPAAAETVSDLDRFKLWNQCGAMELFVVRQTKGAPELGLRKEAIANAVRSRLRAARIYADETHTRLRVRVTVLNSAFSIRVSFMKAVQDELTKLRGGIATWSLSSTGTHGGDAGYILSFLAEHIDIFIDEYLRVNAAACKGDRGDRQ